MKSKIKILSDKVEKFRNQKRAPSSTSTSPEKEKSYERRTFNFPKRLHTFDDTKSLRAGSNINYESLVDKVKDTIKKASKLAGRSNKKNLRKRKGFIRN